MTFARWTRVLLAIFVVCIGLVWAPMPAMACSCEAAPFAARDGNDSFVNFEAVFIGTALSQDQVSQDEVSWVFEVTSVLHGEVASPIELVTPVDGGACGLDWVAEGDAIAVGVNTWQGDLGTDLCSIDKVDAVDGIGERRPPLEPGDPLAINAGAATIADEEPTESAASQIVLIAIGIVSILGAAILTAVLARRSD